MTRIRTDINGHKLCNTKYFTKGENMHYPAPAGLREALPVLTYHQSLFFLTQTCLEFIDITEAVMQAVRKSGIKNGFLNIQTKHTTTAILINENEPLLIEDFKTSLEQLIPSNRLYHHDNFEKRTVNLTPEERPNGHSHCKALFLKTSETVNLLDGFLQLGRWQRIFFLELDAARNREVSVMILGA